MPFSTETVRAGEFILAWCEGMIGDDDFDQGCAVVKRVLKRHGGTRVLMRPKSSNPNSYSKIIFGGRAFHYRPIVSFP